MYRYDDLFVLFCRICSYTIVCVGVAHCKLQSLVNVMLSVLQENITIQYIIISKKEEKT